MKTIKTNRLMHLELLNKSDLKQIIALTKALNPDLSSSILESRQLEMFGLETYRCFGIRENNNLIAVSSGWLTVRLYSGKQLEIDNVIVNSTLQSKGIGTKFLNEIENWAAKNGCKTLELNTYVSNSGSHKFYFKLGYEILGFHFQKKLNRVV